MKNRKRIGLIMVAVMLIVGTWVIPEDSYAATALPPMGLSGMSVERNLTDVFTYTAPASGLYQVDLWGQGAYYTNGWSDGTYDIRGGHVSGTLGLKKGEVIEFRSAPGGNGPTGNNGQAGAGLFMGEKLILGAGGGSGFSWREGKSSNSITGYMSVDPNEIGTWGGGGGGSFQYKSETPQNGQPSPKGVAAGRAGCNYGDLDYIDGYLSEQDQNRNTPAKFKLINVGANIPELESKIEMLIASMAAMTLKETTPIITVLEGHDFNVRLNQYDQMDSISEQGVVISNLDKADGYIMLSGKLNGEGYKDLVVGGNGFTFNIIPEPSSATVTASFEDTFP